MDFLPGYCAGISRVLISHPFDYVRLYLQTNTYSSFSSFFKENKITSLYRGVGVPLIILPIDRAIQFRIYEYLNTYNLSPFLSGSICGCISVLFNLPASYISNNYVLNRNENNLFHYTRRILKNPLQLYNGFKPEFVRSTLATSIYLGIYGRMREWYGNETRQTIINGALAGWSTWSVTYPIESIKVEQQVKNRTITQILKERIHNYGIFNLWKGISPIYIRTLPSSIIGMVVYEKVKKYIPVKI